MAMGKVSNKRQRDIQRVMHLIGAAVLIGYVYLPLGSAPFITTLMQIVIVPSLGVTGMLMWQLPKLRKWLGGKRTSAPQQEECLAPTKERRTETL
ncbi:MAG: hypothetical protein MI924_08205 [Chloroflexales bacterium]|nr:hypothetical protein [Chloroflexales bacterium]